jgi:DNA polymerase I
MRTSRGAVTRWPNTPPRSVSSTPETETPSSNYLAAADQIVAHNGIGYDFPAIKAMGFNHGGGDYYTDTLILSRMCYPHLQELDQKFQKVPTTMWGRHSLESWGWRVGNYKGNYKGPWDVPNKDMLVYCHNDVVVLKGIWEKVKNHKHNTDEFRRVEHTFAEIIRRQERNGFCFNLAYAQRLGDRLSKARASLTDQLLKSFPPERIEMKTPAYWEDPETGEQYETKKAAQEAGIKAPVRGPNKVKVIPFKITERHKFAERLMERHGIEKWPELSETGKPKVDAKTLKKLDYPEARLMKRVLDIQKALDMVAEGKQAWITQVQEDGRIYGKVNTLGARTTRCTHWNPNMAQVPSRHAYRRCFTARPGWVMVGADASGIEARMLAHYMHSRDNGEFTEIVLNGDIHQTNADTWGVSRYAAKAPFYAMLYGAGDAKLGELVKGSSAAGKKIKKQFFKRFPAYKGLLDSVQKAGSWLYGLDGRALHSPNQNSALNTLLQGGGATVMKYALVLFDEKAEQHFYPKDWAYCANVHDEVQIECDPKIAHDIGSLFVQAIRDAGTHLKVRCPLDGEYKIGRTWAHTH